MASQKEIRIKDQCKSALKVQPGDRTPEQLADIIAYTQMAELFPPGLDDVEVLRDLTQNMGVLPVDGGSLLFLQDQPATSYFIIFEGQVEILQSPPEDKIKIVALHNKFGQRLLTPLGADLSKTSLGKKLCTLRANRGFGERALLKDGGKRATHAYCPVPAKIIEIGPELYQRCLRPYHLDQANVGDVFAALQACPLFRGLGGGPLTKMAYGAAKRQLPKGAKLSVKGTDIKSVLLINQGEVTKLSGSAEIKVAVRGKGTFIGAYDFLTDKTQYSSGYSAHTEVEFYEIPIQEFALVKSNRAGVAKYLEEKAASNKLHGNRKNVASEGVSALKTMNTMTRRDLGTLIAHGLVRRGEGGGGGGGGGAEAEDGGGGEGPGAGGQGGAPPMNPIAQALAARRARERGDRRLLDHIGVGAAAGVPQNRTMLKSQRSFDIMIDDETGGTQIFGGDNTSDMIRIKAPPKLKEQPPDHRGINQTGNTNGGTSRPMLSRGMTPSFTSSSLGSALGLHKSPYSQVGDESTKNGRQQERQLSEPPHPGSMRLTQSNRFRGNSGRPPSSRADSSHRLLSTGRPGGAPDAFDKFWDQDLADEQQQEEDLPRRAGGRPALHLQTRPQQAGGPVANGNSGTWRSVSPHRRPMPQLETPKGGGQQESFGMPQANSPGWARLPLQSPGPDRGGGLPLRSQRTDSSGFGAGSGIGQLRPQRTDSSGLGPGSGIGQLRPQRTDSSGLGPGSGIGQLRPQRTDSSGLGQHRPQRTDSNGQVFGQDAMMATLDDLGKELAAMDQHSQAISALAYNRDPGQEARGRPQQRGAQQAQRLTFAGGSLVAPKRPRPPKLGGGGGGGGGASAHSQSFERPSAGPGINGALSLPRSKSHSPKSSLFGALKRGGGGAQGGGQAKMGTQQNPPLQRAQFFNEEGGKKASVLMSSTGNLPKEPSATTTSPRPVPLHTSLQVDAAAFPSVTMGNKEGSNGGGGSPKPKRRIFPASNNNIAPMG